MKDMAVAGLQLDGGNRAIAPSRNFHKRMHLLGAARSYIILTPENVSWLHPWRCASNGWGWGVTV